MVNLKTFAAALALFSLAAASSPETYKSPKEYKSPKPYKPKPKDADSSKIPNRYLVKLRQECSVEETLSQIQTVDSTPPVDTIAFPDGELTILVLDLPAEKVEAVEALPCVEYVEQDQVVSINDPLVV
jgi:hypothetical protein